MQRSRDNETFSLCLAEILGAHVTEIPPSSSELGLTAIGYWLGTQNLALIPVREPDRFQWAGWWIGRLADGDGYVVMAGTPSGVAWSPEGVTQGTQEVVEGWVIAPPALALPRRVAEQGTIEELYRFPASGAPGEPLRSARFVAGVGIEGDRYALGTGHFQSDGRWGQALTLIESEAIETLARDFGIEMPAVAARRNIVTRNIDLNALIG
ncbi:MAG: hypothetical protein AAGD47_11575, partial [Pseudomonadota bacterium]